MIGGGDQGAAWLRSRWMPSLLVAAAAMAGCQPNPRNEIAAVAAAGLAEVRRTAPGQPLCVARTIAPWQPAGQVGRQDPPAPPGFAALYGAGVFRGGGGLKGGSAGGVAVSGRAGCLALHGPLIAGDRAMLEVDVPSIGQNLWMRRIDGDWRVVMTTTSSYSR